MLHPRWLPGGPFTSLRPPVPRILRHPFAFVSSASIFDYNEGHAALTSEESYEDATNSSAPWIKSIPAAASPRGWLSHKTKLSHTLPSCSNGESIDKSDDDVSLAINTKRGNYPMPDMELIGELLGHIERSPPALGARELLVQQYATCGWLEAASEQVHELLKLDPMNVAAKTCQDHLAETTSSVGKGKVKAKETETKSWNSQTEAVRRVRSGIGKGGSRQTQAGNTAV